LIILDRGEIPGRETPRSEAIPRLSSMRPDQPVPLDQWFTLEAVIKLGIGVAKSQTSIDETFDEELQPRSEIIWPESVDFSSVAPKDEGRMVPSALP